MAKENPKENDNPLVLRDTDGTEYNLLEGPGKDSKYVVQAHKKLMKTLRINELANDLANVGKFMLVAHCGVMGHLQLELKVRKRLQSVVKLCDDTVFTLNEFDRASDSAISNMAIAYEYLTEGFEDIALETLQDVSETSKNMAMESSKLEERFGEEANEVEEVHKDTLTERSKVEKANKQTEKDIVQQKQEQNDTQNKFTKVAAEEEKALKELEETLKKENETAEERRRVAQQLKNDLDKVQEKLDAADSEARMACNQAETGFWAGVKSTVTHWVDGKTKDDINAEKVQISYGSIEHQHQDALIKSKELKDAEDKKAKLLKEQREMHAKELENRRKEREEARKKMAEAARKLAESTFEENVQKESLYCLHYAISALKHLQDIMQVAANFWRETHSACNAITGTAMTKQLDRLKALKVEQRKKLWNSKPLKMQAIKYYAQWVAIQEMCSTSRESLISSQHEVHMFVRQNPTKEQAKELIQRLAKELTNEPPLAIESPEDAKKNN